MISGIIDNGTINNIGGGITKTGLGTAVLTAANTYTGGTTPVVGGTLQANISTATPNVLPSAGTVTMAGGTLAINGTATAAAVTQAITTLAFTGGTSSTINLVNNTATATNLTASGTFTAPANGTTLYLNLTGAGATSALTLERDRQHAVRPLGRRHQQCRRHRIRLD